MRIVFAGTPDAAVPALRRLLASRHEVAAVLTRPDAPAGRHRTPRPSPVRVAATAAGIEVLTPRSPGDPAFLERLAILAPQAVPVVAYGALIPQAALDIPAHGWVNLHVSLLPAWRGAAPVQRAIIAGDQVTGACTFLLEAGLDTGPVIDTLTMPIGDADTAGDLIGRLAVAGAELLAGSLDAIEDGTARPRPQPATGVSLAPRLTVAEAQLDWSAGAVVLDRLIRGCTPSPGAWTTFRGQRLKVHQAAPVTGGTAPGDAAPGVVLATKQAVYAGTGDGLLQLLTVQPHGKKPMRAGDWARGARIGPQEMVGT